MADVFLSYKREDSARVRKLVTALRRRGVDVWWDEDIPPSAPWEATIEKALRNAKAVIVCWSPASVESENVRSEARVAREDGRLIQVFVHKCQPPLFFGERQGVDLTRWSGRAKDRRIDEIMDGVRKLAGAHVAETVSPPAARPRLRTAMMAVALLLLAGIAAGWWLLGPAKASGPQTIAVLPFRALNPADANLVDAIWDDTRGALSRNPNLRVLGRQAVEALAKQDLAPADYRRKLRADYLLDGSVQHVGDQVRIKLSLTRTKDATEVWNDELGGKLDDVFAFQQQIAREVEGRLRGRMAPGGGTNAAHIATSGEVYSMFAEARADIRKRDPRAVREGILILRKALAIDPNYAPAWALLGVATGLGVSRSPDMPVDQQEAEAVSYLRRALQLAPNLAQAHAGLAMVQNFPPELEGELREAVALDPNDAEVWTWLGNFYSTQNREEEALAARNRAAEIEPLWPNTVANQLSSLAILHKQKAIDEELSRIAATGDDVLLAKAKWMVAINGPHPSEAINLLLQLRASHPEEAAWIDARISGPLIQLGFIDEGMRASDAPVDWASSYRGEPPAPGVISARYKRAADFWLDDDAPALLGRLLMKGRRLDEYLRSYNAAFGSSGDLIELMKHRPIIFTNLAPTVAAVLRQADKTGDAEALVQRGSTMVETWLHNGPATADLLATLARYRAFEGKDDEAVALLNRAIAAGWLPDRGFCPVDIAEEPTFAALVNRADFRAVRQRILARMEEERRRVPTASVAEAYPVAARSKAAA